MVTIKPRLRGYYIYMKRIIFLDIDGVLNNASFFKSKLRHILYHEDDGYGMSTMISRYHLFWLGLLCRIMKANVVLSSTWRYGWNEDGSVNTDKQGHQMIITDRLFRKFGVNIIGITKRGAIQLQGKYEYNDKVLDDFTSRQHFKGLEDVCSKRSEVLKYARGTQILDWIERNNFTGQYIILEDDWEDVCFYKDLEKRIVITRYYGKTGGFRLRHFIKAIRLFKAQEKII